MIVSLEPDLLERLARLNDTGNQTAAEELDEDLAAAVRRTALMRRLFYIAVLAVALYGTATGAVAAFGLPWWIAVGGIFALELGGVVFLSNADVRRRLGEQAVVSRLVGAVIAAAAATFNVLTHHTLLLGGFFALMSVLGFVTWWLDVENKRRDRLRARGQLAAPTPVYELWGHWLRHPFITARARTLAKTHPRLGLYGSLEAAVYVRRRERRNTALAKALHARIRRTVGRDLAGIAALSFDMDEVARRLRDSADYHGLTALLGSELTSQRLLHGRDDDAAEAARTWLSTHTTGPQRDGLDTGSGRTAGPHSDEHTGPAAPSGATTTQHVVRVLPQPATTGALVGTFAHLTGASGSFEQRPPDAKDISGVSPHPITAPTPTMPDDRDGAATIAAHHQDDGDAASQTTAVSATVGDRRRPVADGRPTTTGLRAAVPARNRVQVRILGTPAILAADGSPLRGIRAKSIELLVYLAIHRHGASLSRIIEAVWPGVPQQRAVQRLSTCLANLRTAARSVFSADNLDPGARVDAVLNTGGRYQLDPAIVDIDWWRLVDGMSTSDRQTEPLQDSLALLQDSCSYPWLDSHLPLVDHSA